MAPEVHVLKMKLFVRSIGLTLLLLSFAISSSAQEQSKYGSITGRVFDSATKDSIPLATVMINGSTLGASTNGAGYFEIKRIPPGTYEVQASAVGYAPVIQREVIVRSSEETRVSFSLTEQSIQVGEVLITGQQIIIPDLPVSTEYLSYKEIHNSAGAFDDVIRNVSTLPGVSQSRSDRNDLIVRGGAASENLFFVDNIEVPNIDHFGTEGSTGGSVSFINLEFVDNTAFSAGGFGVRYGDRLSSVMSIGIREGRTDENHAKATVSATEVGLNLEGPVADGGSYLFSARRSYLDPVFKYYGFAFAPYFWDFLGKVSYQFGKNDKLEMLGLGAIDRIRYFNDNKQNDSSNARQLFCSENTAVGGATWRHGFESGYTMVTLRQSYGDFNYLEQGYGGGRYLSGASYERETSLRGDAVFEATKSTELSAGVEGRIPRLNVRLVTTVITTGYTTDPLVIPVNIKGDTSSLKAAAYAQVSQTIGHLLLTGGIREDYLALIKEKTAFSPRFSASYALSSVTKITGSVGQYSQAPAYIWLMMNPYNRGLTYLKVNQYVVGVEHYLQSDFKISLEGYIKNYFNYPVSLTRPYIVMVNTGTEVMEVAEAYTAFGLDFLQSSGTGFANGVDLFMEKRLSETPFYGRLTLSYGETMFKALDGIYRPSDNDERWKLNIGGGYLIDERWEVTSTFRFYTGRPYTPYTVEQWERTSTDYNLARVGVNHDLDLRVARRWTFTSTNLNCYLDIVNVYNRKQLVPPIWNPAKNIWEKPPEIGMVPSIGVSVEF